MRPEKFPKCPSDYKIGNNTKTGLDYIIRTGSIYIRKITAPPILEFYIFAFHFLFLPYPKIQTTL